MCFAGSGDRLLSKLDRPSPRPTDSDHRPDARAIGIRLSGVSESALPVTAAEMEIARRSSTIHAGFAGQIRLEMVNHNGLRVKLQRRMKVCQLILEQTTGTPVQTAARKKR